MVNCKLDKPCNHLPEAFPTACPTSSLLCARNPLSAALVAGGIYVSWEDVLGLVSKINPDTRTLQNPSPSAHLGGPLGKVRLPTTSVVFSRKRVKCLGRRWGIRCGDTWEPPGTWHLTGTRRMSILSLLKLLLPQSHLGWDQGPRATAPAL